MEVQWKKFYWYQQPLSFHFVQPHTQMWIIQNLLKTSVSPAKIRQLGLPRRGNFGECYWYGGGSDISIVIISNIFLNSLDTSGCLFKLYINNFK